MPNFKLTLLANDFELAKAMAAEWLEEVAAVGQSGAPPCVALAGGRSGRILFESITELGQRGRAALDGVHFFWADERCVPPDHAESNFGLAQQLLFSPLRIAENYIHRIHGEKLPEVSASEAAAEICRIAPSNTDGQPVLDLIFLGMGEDGHVASLFPGELEVVRSNNAVYRAIKNSPKPPPNRVTLGYAAIAAAKQVWVLVLGGAKAAALRESLDPSGRTPLARVLQSRSHTRIFSDILPN